MKNKKGFTLIELLAVIIILGILLIIAIPSVTSYISDSRKSSYIDTAKEIIGGARNLVNEGKLNMYDTDTTYYINASCIETENALKSPYGDFAKAYVVVTYNGSGYNYYWASVDITGHGIKNITSYDNLNEDLISTDLTLDDIDETKKLEDNSKYVIIDESCEIGDTKDVVHRCVVSDPSVRIWSDRAPVMYPGQVVHFFSEITGFDGCEMYLAWEYQENDGAPWIEIDPETDNRYFFTENRSILNVYASVEVLGYNHRLTVYYR